MVDRQDGLLIVQQAAERLSCSVAGIRKWIYRGHLKPVKLGRLVRLRAADVDKAVQYGLERMA